MTSPLRRWRPRAVGAVGVVGILPAAALAFGPTTTCANAHWHPGAHVLSYGYPQLPPPVASKVWSQFMLLYVTYTQLDADDRPSFGAWLAMNGVSDPHTVIVMQMWYSWLQERRG